jgi:hypothetical protein
MGPIHEINKRPKISCYCPFKYSCHQAPETQEAEIPRTPPLPWLVYQGIYQRWAYATSPALPQYCKYTNRLRKCGPKKGAEICTCADLQRKINLYFRTSGKDFRLLPRIPGFDTRIESQIILVRISTINLQKHIGTYAVAEHYIVSCGQLEKL